jgi:hypothetical protein
MPPAVPIATYRLQLTGAFGFDHAAALVPYLNALGVSHLYASPFLKARAGSQHGYDIVDHNALNPELGGEEGFARLSAALAQEDIGLILDFVPNHMAVGGADNAWWLDVLEWGPKSSHAPYFDIDWELLPHRRAGGVLLPQRRALCASSSPAIAIPTRPRAAPRPPSRRRSPPFPAPANWSSAAFPPIGQCPAIRRARRRCIACSSGNGTAWHTGGCRSPR